jgi:HTH-type transcriptional regulator, sugar sensing transcriptional regulator
MLEKTLQKMGFDEKEARLYLALLELGEAGVQDIARKSGLKRTTVYHILESLKTRGIVSLAKKGKKTLFVAEDPRSIGEDIKEKEAIFKKSLPELLSMANILEKKPQIRYFEGLAGIKEAYRDELTFPDNELLAWWSKSYEIFGQDFFYDYYMPQRLKNKISVRAIAPENEYTRRMKTEEEKQLRKMKLTPNIEQGMELEISLYGKNKISIKSFEEKFALIIESKALFNTMKGIFELQWKTLPEKSLNKNLEEKSQEPKEKQEPQKATEEDIYY